MPDTQVSSGSSCAALCDRGLPGNSGVVRADLEALAAVRALAERGPTVERGRGVIINVTTMAAVGLPGSLTGTVIPVDGGRVAV